jgi:hypothetical protein
LLAFAKHLEASHVLQLFTGFDGAVEIGDPARDFRVIGQEGLACGLGLLLAAAGLQELRLWLADGSPCLHGGVEAGAHVLELPPCPVPGPPAQAVVPGHRLCLLVGDGGFPCGACGFAGLSAGPATGPVVKVPCVLLQARQLVLRAVQLG